MIEPADTTPETAADITDGTETPPESTTETPEPGTPGDGEGAPDSERKLRKRAQAAEAERDQLRARVDALTKRQVEQLVGTRLHKASDLWIGTNVTDLLDDNGDVDVSKLDAAVTALRAEKPYLGPNAAAPTAAVTFGAEKPDLGEAQPPSWQQLLQGAQRKL